jgi:hypothetical protein
MQHVFAHTFFHALSQSQKLARWGVLIQEQQAVQSRMPANRPMRQTHTVGQQ